MVSASNSELRKRLTRQLHGLKVRGQDRVKSLGAALGAGHRRNTQVATKRLRDFKARRGRFHLLKKSK
eukprot:7204069-Karenia_brevis.AAC.1